MSARGLVAVAVLAAFGSSCVRVEATTRTERGPLLRTFQRPEVAEGGLVASVDAKWPALTLKLTAYDTCVDATVEEYVEEEITERTAPAAGPAFSTGTANVLASGVLALISLFLTDKPNVAVIDAAGHYGPSQRQVVQGWSWVTLGIGLPALVVGIVGVMQAGEDKVTRKVEQVASRKEHECNERPVTGPVELRGANGAIVFTREVTDGVLEVAAADVKAGPETVHAFGRTVQLAEDSGRAFLAWAACVDAQAPLDLQVASYDALSHRADLLRSCREVRGGDVAKELAEVDAAMQSHMAGTEAQEPAPAPTWDEAQKLYAPTQTFTADEKVLSALDKPLDLVGQAVLLQGVVASRPGDRSAVLRVGPREVWLESPWPWPASVVSGTRAEAIAVGIGAKPVGAKELPAFRVMAVRPAF